MNLAFSRLGDGETPLETLQWDLQRLDHHALGVEVIIGRFTGELKQCNLSLLG